MPLISALLSAAIVAAPSPPPTQIPRAAVAPILGPGTVAVLRIDVAKADPVDLARRLAGPEAATAAKPLADWLAPLRAAGAKELDVVLDLSSLALLAEPPVVAVPLGDGVDADAARRALAAPGPFPLNISTTVRGVLIAGSQSALDRIKAAEPVDRPDLQEALAEGGDAPVRLAISPGPGVRRSLEETIANLPEALGGGPIELMTRGMKWASVAITTDPQSAVRMTVRGAEEGQAKALGEIARMAVSAVATMARNDPGAVDFVAVMDGVRPEVRGDRVVAELAPDLASRLVMVPIRRAQVADHRARSFNNIKQIGLAMHNYRATHNTFPPAYRAGADGKPLLSWRVLVLPYVEQKELYDQFHLDEPWDSPHNLPLAAKMPAIYAAPAAGSALAAEGKTTYQTLRGPGTMFPGGKGIKLDEITDGTSNTIMVAEVQPNRAVVWTQPSDFDMPPSDGKLKDLFNPIAGGTNFGIADGSARFIAQTIHPIALMAISSRNGGEVVDWSKF